MNLLGLMETSGSAMQAERIRAEIVTTNMANAETTRTESGEPYRRQMVVFQANAEETPLRRSSALAESPWDLQSANGAEFPGVHIAAVVADPGPPLKRYDPGHPDADAEGYVSYPNINPVTEMVDLMSATRAYGLNGSAIQAEKSMIGSALEIARA